MDARNTLLSDMDIRSDPNSKIAALPKVKLSYVYTMR